MKKLWLLLFWSPLFASQTLMVDRHLSPYSGSASLLFAQNTLIQTEDYFFDGEGHNGTAKVWGRTLEQLFFWYPINMISSVTQHEFFGHGYRLRELGTHPKKYSISPWGGATYFKMKESDSIGKLLAVDVAGLEGESILARDTKMEWIRRGEIDGRLSTVYTQAAQSLFWYTLITKRGSIHDKGALDGNDVSGYIFLHNITYPDHELSISKLTRWSLLNLLDPMTFYAYYSYFYYMAEGKPWSFPMLPLSENIRYLPNIRIAYAPYAPEAYCENFFSIYGKPLYFYFKGGERSWGMGFAYDHFLSGNRGSLGVRFDGWNHNIFETPSTIEDLIEDTVVFHSIIKKRKWGCALSLTSSIRLFSKLSLFLEVGGKTSGYLPGYSLGKEIVGRIGLTIDMFKEREKQVEAE